ncbi:3-aminobutyryl-CoA ammonia-lyase [Oscillibacter sp. PC13]|uniref:hotdog fold domain-containing protein n=1 Tax=Oscillibacter sp. PC13 TaxID=1855299 RepID=UPI0008F154F4|nr:hotdog domain-containing protein [Oscillibacter sp. PC13]SFQ15998.1 3-aminobutyryl-CoA ammonia-lyase [Oscillibacter sp. PC13]
MIGQKVSIKARMSTGEAHYAGDLVNGSHILDFWGDVATELAIRLHGDEGLFYGYDNIRFLAPIYAGDFVEYVGWVEKVGNTSMVCKFEAYKHIQLSRTPNLAVSSADVIDTPELCAFGTGIVVVKKEEQRGAQDPLFVQK